MFRVILKGNKYNYPRQCKELFTTYFCLSGWMNSDRRSMQKYEIAAFQAASPGAILPGDLKLEWLSPEQHQETRYPHTVTFLATAALL